VIDKFSTVRCREAFLNLSEKPLGVADKAFDRFRDQRFGGASLLSGQAAPFFL
jgi:hypothetical protein